MTAHDLRQPVQPITKAALEAAFAKIVGTGPGAVEQTYLTQAHEDYSADETPELSGEDLAALLAASWSVSRSRRTPRSPNCRSTRSTAPPRCSAGR